jgi:predicted deacetylase
MAVHVSIHDVSPAWEREVEEALALAADVGVKPALLVVPNFHGRWPLLDHPEFCARLRDLQGRGHEIYLHGFFHKSRPLGADDADLPARPAHGTHESGAPSRLAWIFAQRIASGGEAEFSDVSRDEAVERLDRGERVLGDAGLTIDGFIAPAWSMPAWLLPLLGARGYRFSEDHTRVYDPSRGRAKASVVLNYASRTKARMLSTVAYCRVAKHARALFPARVAIHPGDMRVPLLQREVRALLAWGAGDYVPRGDALLG